MRTWILTVEESRYLEREANERGVGFAQMMENAGRRTALTIQERFGISDRRVVVLVGPGNNGGDGLVAAHYLLALGSDVTCYVWKRPPVSDVNYDRVVADGVPVIWAQDDQGYRTLQALVLSSDVVVDALLGVGVSRPIEGSLSELLGVVREALDDADRTGLGAVVPSIRDARPKVVAVDCPTGLDCDTGALDPASLTADVTVTFAGPKRGMIRFPGAEAIGELVVADIGVPDDLLGTDGWEMATADLVRSWLPTRPRSANKGSFGRALIVAGSVDYTGAASLAGTAATRVGTGLVTLGLPAPIQPAVAAQLAEATYLLLPHDLGVVSSGAVESVVDKAASYDALLLGPGLTQESETVSFVLRLLGVGRGSRSPSIGFVASTSPGTAASANLPPLVVDADALNALATAHRWWAELPAGTTLTPHPGEMARLMGEGTQASDVQAEREDVCRRMAAKWRAVVVLKGAFTVVADPEGQLVVIPFANAGLATAGSGDVLAGVIVGLRAQGMGALQAAVAGAYVHGLAGELARADLGDMGMVAGDVALRLPLALRRIRKGRS